MLRDCLTWLADGFTRARGACERQFLLVHGRGGSPSRAKNGSPHQDRQRLLQLRYLAAQLADLGSLGVVTSAASPASTSAWRIHWHSVSALPIPSRAATALIAAPSDG